MYQKVFIYKFRVFYSILWCFIGYLFIRAIIIYIDFRSESTIYIVVSLLLVSAIIFGYIYVFLYLYGKIIVNPTGIIITRPFKKYEFEWPEIVEFKKHNLRYGYSSYSYRYRYYLSAKKYEQKPIAIADYYLLPKDIDVLIATIFRNATNARFNKIENDSVLPFVKKYKMSKWELKDEYD